MQSVTNFLHTAADTARETIASVTPVSNVSTFVDSGHLTPDVCCQLCCIFTTAVYADRRLMAMLRRVAANQEFVVAGDKLVALCPTWRWYLRTHCRVSLSRPCTCTA